jgi:hypothetical protein
MTWFRLLNHPRECESQYKSSADLLSSDCFDSANVTPEGHLPSPMTPRLVFSTPRRCTLAVWIPLFLPLAVRIPLFLLVCTATSELLAHTGSHHTFFSGYNLVGCIFQALHSLVHLFPCIDLAALKYAKSHVPET